MAALHGSKTALGPQLTRVMSFSNAQHIPILHMSTYACLYTSFIENHARFFAVITVKHTKYYSFKR